ncbi:MAG: hypothetical protein MJY65_02065 [Bacteroidaceae bacterium]|nr:hypothetical protein [Bacteroidaceae bacterium]
MKKYFFYLALAVCAAMTVSCKNKNAKNVENEKSAKEVVEVTKTILADDVLSAIDGFAQTYIEETGKNSISSIIAANLTDKEKLVKPDYLLDPKEANSMITRSQKINALAILVVENEIRKAYGMPIDESKESIARLIIDLNHSISLENQEKMSISEKIKEDYNNCREQGEIAAFWQFNSAVMREIFYIVSQNPEPFFRNMTDEQCASIGIRFKSCRDAAIALAEYDEEIAAVIDAFSKYRNKGENNDADTVFSSVSSMKQYFISSKDAFAAYRAELLKQ